MGAAQLGVATTAAREVREIWRRRWLCYLGRIKGSGENLEAQFEFGVRRGKGWFPFRGLSRQLESRTSRARHAPRISQLTLMCRVHSLHRMHPGAF